MNFHDAWVQKDPPDTHQNDPVFWDVSTTEIHHRRRIEKNYLRFGESNSRHNNFNLLETGKTLPSSPSREWHCITAAQGILKGILAAPPQSYPQE